METKYSVKRFYDLSLFVLIPEKIIFFDFNINHVFSCLNAQLNFNWIHCPSNNWSLSCCTAEIPIQIYSQIPMTWQPIHVHEAHLLIGIIQFWLWCCIAIHLLHFARFRTRKALQCNNRLQTRRLNCYVRLLHVRNCKKTRHS